MIRFLFFILIFPATLQAQRLETFDHHFAESKIGKIQKRESEGFVVEWINPKDSIFVDALLEHLELADKDLTPVFRNASGPHKKVPVEVFPDLKHFSEVSQLPLARFKATGTIALTLDQRLMILSPRNLPTGYPWATTIVHEYTHYLIREISPELIPIWLHEGVAQFYQEYPYQKKVSLKPAQWGLFKKYKEKKGLLDLKTLQEPFPYRKNPEEAELAYVQSLLFVQWLDAKCGVVNLIRDTDRLKSLGTALSKCVGTSERKLAADFIPKILGGMKVPNRKDVQFFARDFSGADPLEFESRQANRQSKNFAQLSTELFKQGRFRSSTFEMEKALEGDSVAPPSWRRQLALAYQKSNQLTKAHATLQDVLSDYPEDAGSWYLLGIELVSSKKLEEGWKAFLHAFYVNPFLDGLEDNMKVLKEAKPKLAYRLN